MTLKELGMFFMVLRMYEKVTFIFQPQILNCYYNNDDVPYILKIPYLLTYDIRGIYMFIVHICF